jgi:hypothetical protein
MEEEGGDGGRGKGGGGRLSEGGRERGGERSIFVLSVGEQVQCPFLHSPASSAMADIARRRHRISGPACATAFRSPGIQHPPIRME